jgi:hypothetical protein
MKNNSKLRNPTKRRVEGFGKKLQTEIYIKFSVTGTLENIFVIN